MTLEDLKAYQGKRQEAERLRERIEELEAKAVGISGGKIDGMPKGPAQTANVKEQIIVSLVDEKSRYIKLLQELSQDMAAIEAEIEKLDSFSRDTIRRRFIFGESVEDIAEAKSYSRTRMYELLYEAIYKLEKRTEAGIILIPARYDKRPRKADRKADRKGR